MDKVSLALIAALVYMAFMVVVGLIASRRSRTFTDYAVAGRRLGLPMVYATILATWFGTGLAVGGASMAYLFGYRGVIMDPIGAGVSILIFGLFFASILRKKGYITISDFFRERYGRGMELLSAVVQVIAYMGWSASLLVTFGTIMSTFTGMEYREGLLIGVGITIIYTTIGGLWSVVYTDLIQAALLVTGILLLFKATLDAVGGLGVFGSEIPMSTLSILPEEGFGYLGYTGLMGAAFYISSWLVQGIGATTSQDLVQRAVAARDERVARRAAIAASVSYIVLGLVPATIGIMATLLYPSLENPDEVLPRVALDLLPTIPFVLFTIGLLAALMSSADSAILVPSVVIAENIAPRLGLSGDRVKYLVAKASVPLIALVSLAIALQAPTIYFLMNLSWELILMTHAVPFIAGLLSTRLKEKAVLTAVIAGLALWITLTLMLIPVTYAVEGDMEYAAWDAVYIAAPLALLLEVVIVAVSLLKK
ncbi:MAG: hypothetical protein F7C81_01280 [Desulfurococcales archaeon]|nr:hypothetical protein [Desulfurococcales archaeon]